MHCFKPLTAVKEKVEQQFFDKLKQESKLLSNLGVIVEKLQVEGYLKSLTDSVELTLNNEINFTIYELKKIGVHYKPIDIKNQLTSNTYIFKENLKILMNYISIIISRVFMERQNEK